jgi:integrase
MPIHKFTARSIPKPPSAGRIDYWDKSLPSFGMRVSAGGARTWVVMYRYNGTKRRMTLGKFPQTGLAAARDEAREVLRWAEKGADPASEKRGRKVRTDTIEDLANAYLEQYAKKNKRSWKKDVRYLNNEVLPVIGRKRVTDTTRQDIRDVLQPIIDRDAPVHAARTLEVVRKMFNWAIAEKDMAIDNPAAKIPPPGKAEDRTRFLKPDEIKKFWNALTPELVGELGAVAFKLMLLTAQRSKDVLQMRRSDLDWEARTWTQPAGTTKNGLEHVVPLGPVAYELAIILDIEACHEYEAALKAYGKEKRPGDEPVYAFPSPVKLGKPVTRVFVAKRWEKILEATGITDFTPHDLRRTAVTYFGKLKISQGTKKKIIHHAKRKKSDPTDIYDRFEYLSEKRQALGRWEMLLIKMVGEEGFDERARLADASRDEDDNVVSIEQARGALR